MAGLQDTPLPLLENNFFTNNSLKEEEEKEEEKVKEEGGTTKEQKFLASKGHAFPMQYRSCYILASSPNIGQECFGKAGKSDFLVPLQEI